MRTTHTSARLAQVKSALTEGVNYLAAVSALQGAEEAAGGGGDGGGE